MILSGNTAGMAEKWPNNAAYYNEQASAPMRYPGFTCAEPIVLAKRPTKSPKWAGEFVDRPGDVLETVQRTPRRLL